jgi:transcriptional regulator with XRE-family HTH domain
MSNPMKNWEKIKTKIPVHIPTVNGKEISETVEVEVSAYRNPKDGEIYLDGDALQVLDDTKARYMGLMLPEAVRHLRQQLGVTQKRMAALLQIGEKSYCRWETGRERPSRSMNVLLAALNDGRIDVAYLESRLSPDFNWRRQIEQNVQPGSRVVHFDFKASPARTIEESAHCHEPLAA